MGSEIWKTIKIGIYKDLESLKDALLQNGFRIGDWANDILEKTELSSEKKSIDLVKISVEELGLTKGAYKKDIYKKAFELGLKLCPPEIGPHLRLQYNNQEKLESLQIAMEPISDSTGHFSEFRIVHSPDGYLWLVGDHKHPDNFWKSDEFFVFTS